MRAPFFLQPQKAGASAKRRVKSEVVVQPAQNMARKFYTQNREDVLAGNPKIWDNALRGQKNNPHSRTAVSSSDPACADPMTEPSKRLMRATSAVILTQLEIDCKGLPDVVLFGLDTSGGLLPFSSENTSSMLLLEKQHADTSPIHGVQKGLWDISARRGESVGAGFGAKIIGVAAGEPP